MSKMLRLITRLRNGGDLGVMHSPWARSTLSLLGIFIRPAIADSQRRCLSVSPHLYTLPKSRNVQLGPTPAPNDPPQRDQTEEDFGSFSENFSSRRVFRKTSPDLLDLQYKEEVEEEEQKRFRSRTGRRNTTYWYFLQCKKLIKQNKLPEALAMFENEMLKGERLSPEEYNYTVLIGGCGRVRYLKKAFKLYNDMKKRGLQPTDATYTALFNACAEAPWKSMGSKFTLHLQLEIRKKNIPLNAITYHALLKSHALCSDLKSCMDIFREMVQKGHPLTQETFQFLLMACVSDPESGFRLALQVWHQMLKMRLKPDLQNYNLLLRAARDCGIGNSAVASSLLLRKDSLTPLLPKGKGERGKGRAEGLKKAHLDVDTFESHLFMDRESLSADSAPVGRATLAAMDTGVSRADEMRDEDWAERNNSTNGLSLTKGPSVPIGSLNCPSTVSSCLPNLLELNSGDSNVVTLGKVSHASHRLALIGNMEGFLGSMETHGLSPNIKTLTLLADIMDTGSENVQSLLAIAKQHKVKVDVPFFNTLVRRAARAGDLDGAKALLLEMTNRRLAPDQRTYCSLALGCVKQSDGLQVLADMEGSGIRPNAHVFSALIGHASRTLNYSYLKELLRNMKTLQVAPNEVIIRQLEFAAQYPPNFDRYKSKNNYLDKIDGFRGYYQQWLKTMPGEESPHPWAQFQLPGPGTAAPDQQSSSSPK